MKPMEPGIFNWHGTVVTRDPIQRYLLHPVKHIWDDPRKDTVIATCKGCGCSAKYDDDGFCWWCSVEQPLQFGLIGIV